MTTKPKDNLIIEAIELGLNDGIDFVNLTKIEIQEMINAKLAEALEEEPNPLLDDEPEASAPKQNLKNENDPVVELTIEEKCAVLEAENLELKEQIAYNEKVTKENEGKDRLSRLEQAKGKLEGQIKGYYKMSIFDMQELFSLI